jgi:hypothetical protein
LTVSHTRERSKTGSGVARTAGVRLTRASSPLIRMQRTLGNAAVQRFTRAFSLPSAPTIGSASDPLEREAESAAGQVVGMSEPQADALEPGAPRRESLTPDAAGDPLPDHVRAFMEPRFGADLSSVRVHAGKAAAHLARELGARAFTWDQDIYYGRGDRPANDALTAHELLHTLQQRSATQPLVQRVVELRPPGRGEATAYDRRQELVDRLNALSPAIQYHLEDVAEEGGRPREALRYEIVDEDALTEFDRRMRDFIDRDEIVPMRLLTSAGRVGGGALWVDNYNMAYVDIDDMLASEDTSFQMNLVHLLEERVSTRNYARRIGTAGMPGLGPAFERVHRRGLDAEAELLRDILNDPTIRFVSEFQRPGDTEVFMFRSARGYVVFHIFRQTRRPETGGVIQVLTADGRRIALEEFLAEQAAAPVAVPAPGGP